MSKNSFNTNTFKNTEAYNHRDVLSLSPLTSWTSEEKQVHMTYNRILQPGFLRRNAKEFVEDANLLKEGWLTDVACPSVEAETMLNIGAEMVVRYQVPEDKLGEKAIEVFNKLPKESIANIKQELEKETKSLEDVGGKLHKNSLEASARDYITKKNEYLEKTGKMPIPLDSNSIEAAMRLLKDKEIRSITDRLTKEMIYEKMPQIEQDLNLQKKTLLEVGKTNDFVFLGAAGSGKSTISKGMISDDKRVDSIVISTDNYRVFVMPGTQEHEKLSTKNTFAKSQDFAYMVKEKVISKLESKEFQNERPNIVFDGITFEWSFKKFLNKEGQVKSAIAAYPDFSGIAERAENRAKDKDASPADKDRYVNTTSLLMGHADASKRLLTSIPPEAITTIYSTKVEKGEEPIEIAVIHEKDKIMEISNLHQMSSFLNKANINQNATNELELIFGPINYNIFATHPEMKAKSILDLIPASGFKADYTLRLVNEVTNDRNQVEKIPYAELKKENGQIVIKVLDTNIYKEKALSNSIEGQVLRAMTRQAHFGDLGKSLDNSISNGDISSFKSCAPGLNNNENINKISQAGPAVNTRANNNENINKINPDIDDIRKTLTKNGMNSIVTDATFIPTSNTFNNTTQKSR